MANWRLVHAEYGKGVEGRDDAEGDSASTVKCADILKMSGRVAKYPDT